MGKQLVVRRRKSIVHMSHYQQEHTSVHSRRFTIAGMCILTIICPILVICVWHTMVNMDGSIRNLWNLVKSFGFDGLRKICPTPSLYAFKLIAAFGSFEAILQLYVPGERYVGPLSPAGNRSVYKKNGFACYMITIFVYYFLYKEKFFQPVILYNHLGEIYSTLIATSFVVCCLLYLKGHTYQSSSDWGTSGNPIIDFYWGMELYPRIGKGFDIKIFTNSRFGMMSWAILIISFSVKQIELKGRLSDSMMVSVTLMLVYITKFFWWESGYFSTLDMMHDRAGFYNVWGHMVWMPSICTSPALYLVTHPVQLGRPLAITIFAAGLVCIYVNYDCDIQKQIFREGNGKHKVWAMIPSKIQAHFPVETGEHKINLLLYSGWWGIARHFHYAAEIAATFFWTVPALFTHALPYFYMVCLTLLLLDRVERDDKRCSKKYDKFWILYKKKVPYKIVPHVY